MKILDDFLNSKDTFSSYLAFLAGIAGVFYVGHTFPGVYAPGFDYAALMPIFGPMIIFSAFVIATFMVSRIITSSLFGFEYLSVKVNADDNLGNKVEYKEEKKRGILDYLFSIHAPFKTTLDEIVEQLAKGFHKTRASLQANLSKLRKETAPRELTNDRPVKVQVKEYKNVRKERAKARKDLIKFDNETITFLYNETNAALKKHPDLFYPSDIKRLEDKEGVKQMVQEALFQTPFIQRAEYKKVK